MSKYNIFIDESCHLEHDESEVMTIGYVRAPLEHYDELKHDLIELKYRHGIPHEFKWNTSSNTKKEFYKELIDYFFDSSLTFRTIVVKYKKNLDHNQYNQGSHDNFYYKMIYFLLNNPFITSNEDEYRVFLDIKDTRGREKIAKIKEVFNNFHHGQSPYIHFQHIRSHESVFIQLADFFIGAITYKSRGIMEREDSSPVKKFIVEYLEEKSGYMLDEGTEPWEMKFNIFDHQPRKSV